MKYKKILVLCLAGIGDTLCSIPLINEMRKIYPESRIDVLVMWRGSKEILEQNPNINNVYYFNMIKKGFFRTILFCLKLRNNEYDLSINSYPQSKLHYRIISKIINAKKRIGHSYDNKNFLDYFLLTDQINQDYNKHFIENNLNLLRLLTSNYNPKKEIYYQLFFSNGNEKYMRKFLSKKKLNGKILFGISTGSGSTKNMSLRKWPLAYYESLIKKILKSNNSISFLLFTGPEELKENELLLKIINDKRVVLVKSENILDSAKIVEKCKFFLSMDNIMMHFAAALNVPNQIVIKTPTLNKTSEPFKRKYILVGGKIPKGVGYRYDGGGIKGKKEDIINYMKSITPKDVYENIKKLIKVN